MYDVRALGNWILDRADQLGRPVSNLALNKLIYFIYQHFLSTRGQVLTQARIEAWEHGPVFREIYHTFKACGSAPITGRAFAFDVETRSMVRASASFDECDLAELEEVLNRYIGFDALQLREISHERGGPWDKVWHGKEPNPGLVISDSIILESVRERTLQ